MAISQFRYSRSDLPMAEASGDVTDYATRHRSSLLLLNAHRNPSSEIASWRLANFATRDPTCQWRKASGDAADYATRHRSSLLLLNAHRNPSSETASCFAPLHNPSQAAPAHPHPPPQSGRRPCCGRGRRSPNAYAPATRNPAHPRPEKPHPQRIRSRNAPNASDPELAPTPPSPAATTPTTTILKIPKSRKS